MTYWIYYKNDYLSHHGILGQEWGKRHGPPYPLDASDHSASEKKAGWRKSLSSYQGDSTTEPLSIREKRNRIVARIKLSYDVDTKSGLRFKDRRYGEKEDMAKVNPDYSTDSGARRNCMLCSTAYELRRRGYDVTANKVAAGFSSAKIKEWFPKAKIQHSSVYPRNLKELEESRRRALSSKGNTDLSNDVIKRLTEQGNGARGNLMVGWGHGGGHSVVYEVKNGKVIIRDCQSNKRYNDAEKLLKKCITAEYVRLDNVDFDKKRIREAVR